MIGSTIENRSKCCGCIQIPTQFGLHANSYAFEHWHMQRCQHSQRMPFHRVAITLHISEALQLSIVVSRRNKNENTTVSMMKSVLYSLIYFVFYLWMADVVDWHKWAHRWQQIDICSLSSIVHRKMTLCTQALWFKNVNNTLIFGITDTLFSLMQDISCICFHRWSFAFKIIWMFSNKTEIFHTKLNARALLWFTPSTKKIWLIHSLVSCI